METAGEKKAILLRFGELVMKHPFLTAALMCLLSMSMTTVELGGLCCVIPAMVFGLCCAIGIGFASEGMKYWLMVITGLIAAIFSLFFGCMLYMLESPKLILLFFGIGTAAACLMYLFTVEQLDGRKAALMFIIAGFIIRLVYILSFDIKTMQHDVGSIEKAKGHIGYIAYLLDNGHLPDFDPTTVYQFYHPPLHHIISALWVKFQMSVGIDQKEAFENIQILTLFYSSVCMVISYKIFKRLKLSGAGLAAATAVVAFCPTFYILGGSINNDILSLTLLLAAVLNTLCWLEKHSFIRLMCIAVCVGGSMMAKLSGWMAAPAIAFIFLYVFFSEKGKKKLRYTWQYAVFLAVCAPIGMWWEVRNNIKFDVPLAYVLKLSETSKQYIGDIPVMKRLFDFTSGQFEKVGLQSILFDDSYNEYNPLVGLFKTSDFDELFTVKRYDFIAGFDEALFWGSVVAGLAAFAAMIYVLAFDRKLGGVQKIFTSILYVTYFVSYYSFCLTFPHVCTQNIRYAVPLIVLGAYFLGRFIQCMHEKGKNGKKLVYKIISAAGCVIAGFYSIASIVMYGMIFMHV